MPESDRGHVYLTGGTARGARLYSVPGKDVRPALARLRTSVFEILRPRLADASVADLFAGTGSMGLESLSRDAAFCAFIDRDVRCVEVLKKNLAKLRFESRAAVLTGDALRAAELLAPLGRTFGAIFVDPPYAMYDDPAESKGLESAIQALVPLLAPDGQFVVEHRTTQDLPEGWGGGRLADRRKYGGTSVSWYGR